MTFDWQVDSAIATMVSAGAVLAGTIFIVYQLRQQAKDRYFQITQQLFEIWQSAEFQEDQLLLLHKLQSPSWDQFIANGRGERAERAMHRVGGYYDRVGSLIERKLIDPESLLPTIGGYAISVWSRIEPLVQELRKRENAFLFQYFEKMLPECRECYVPFVSGEDEGPRKASELEFVDPPELKASIDLNATAVLDVSKEPPGCKIKGAIRTEPNELAGWLAALAPNKPVTVYCG